MNWCLGWSLAHCKEDIVDVVFECELDGQELMVDPGREG